jgi:hypothetical protein
MGKKQKIEGSLVHILVNTKIKKNMSRLYNYKERKLVLTLTFFLLKKKNITINEFYLFYATEAPRLSIYTRFSTAIFSTLTLGAQPN